MFKKYFTYSYDFIAIFVSTFNINQSTIIHHFFSDEQNYAHITKQCVSATGCTAAVNNTTGKWQWTVA